MRFLTSDRLKVGLLAVLTVAVAVVWGLLLTAPPKSEPFTPPAGVASSPVATDSQRVTVVAGAFTAPTQFGGQGAAGWPQLLASRFNWQVTTLANDGAGYVTPGLLRITLPGLKLGVIVSRPDVVLLAGGRADVEKAGAQQVADAARTMVADLRQALPQARIVVLGPVATDATPPAGALELRNALRTAVTSVPNTTFVDPLAENWFANAPANAIAPDGQHPTDAGHRLIADRLAADLVRLGVARR